MNNFELLDEYNFLKYLAKDTLTGRKIVPLVGAGISVASGIPAIPQIEDYLRNCILLALHSSKSPQPWTPEYQWPELDFFHDHPQQGWDNVLLDNSFGKSGFGASSGWRQGLDFLSRITTSDPGKQGPPNSGVVDSFFRHVTAGKRPNLAHRMMANLASIGCIDLLLTTNFDELIESAFNAYASLTLTTLELHSHTDLPPYSTFDNRESNITLIKLHGGRFGLRADDSLDVSASEIEQKRFREYFFRQGESAELGNAKESSASLFLAGISLQERRLKSLIAQLRGSNGPNIFVCCFSNNDVELAIKFDRELEQLTNRKISDEERPKIKIHQTRDVGLLLFHFYQMMNCSLPTKGAITANQVNIPWPTIVCLKDKHSIGSQEEFDSYANQPIKKDPETEGDSKSQILQKNLQDRRIFDMGEIVIQESLRARFDKIAHPDKSQNSSSDKSSPSFNEVAFRQCRKFINARLDLAKKSGQAEFMSVFGTQQYQGVSALMGCIFHDRVETGENCVWFDLDTAGSVDDFYEKLIECIVAKNGNVTWSNPRRRWANEFRIDQMNRELQRGQGRWLIMINAREGAGTNGPKVSRNVRNEMSKVDPPENGWLDISESSNETSRFTDNFNDFLKFISGILDARHDIDATFVIVGHEKSIQKKEKESTTSEFFKEIQKRVEKKITLMGTLNPNINDLRIEIETAPLAAFTNGSPASGYDSSEPIANDSKSTDETAANEISGQVKASRDQANPGLQKGTGEVCLWKNSSLIKFESEVSTLNENTILDGVLDWLTLNPENEEFNRFSKIWFLIALLKMRKPRNWAAPFGNAFRPNKNGDLLFKKIGWQGDSESAEKYIWDLVDTGLIRLKPGGFLWLNSRARDQIVLAIESTPDQDWPEVAKKIREAAESAIQANHNGRVVNYDDAIQWMVGKISFGIASSYRRELQATGEAISAIDAIRHYVEGCRYFLELAIVLQKLKKPSKNNLAIKEAAIDFVKLNIAYSIQLLQDYEFSVIHQGVANCKCRRFEFIQDDIDDLIQICTKDLNAMLFEATSLLLELKKQIWRVSARIAQETGFVRRAYTRWRQIIWTTHSFHQFSDATKQGKKSNQKQEVSKFLAQLADTRALSANDLKSKESESPIGQQNPLPTDSILEHKRNEVVLREYDSEWLEYQRTIAVLHLASRSYYASQNSIIRVLHEIYRNKKPANPPSKTKSFDSGNDFSNLLFQDKFSNAKFTKKWVIEKYIELFSVSNSDSKKEILAKATERSDEFFKDDEPHRKAITFSNGKDFQGTNIWATKLQTDFANCYFEIFLRDPTICSKLTMKDARELVKIGVRQMQLAVEITMIIDWIRELDGEYSPAETSSRRDFITLIQDLAKFRDLSLETGKTAYAAVTRALDWFGNKIGGTDNKNGNRVKLLGEMQKLETYSAVLSQLQGIENLKKGDCKSAANNARLSLRSLDHATAWLDLKPGKISTAIIILERAALHLAYAEGGFLDVDSMLDEFLYLKFPTKKEGLNNEARANKKAKALEAARSSGQLCQPFSSWLRLFIKNNITNLRTDGWSNKLISNKKNVKQHLRDVVDEAITAYSRKINADDGENNFATNLVSIYEKARVGDRLVGDAWNLIAHDTQTAWWKGYADQLILQAQRIYLAVAIGKKKTPDKMKLAIGHEWKLEFENVMERLDERTYMDNIRYARCLQLYCDCSLFVFVLYGLEDHDQSFKPKLKQLQKKIAEYKNRLVEMENERRRVEKDHKRLFENRLTQMYVERVKANCDRTFKILSLAISQG